MCADPASVAAEHCLTALVYLLRYAQRVMFLDGIIEQWLCIFNFQQLGMTQMPRDAIYSIAGICNNHMIYLMVKAYYLNLSWGQTVAYHSFSLLLEHETKEKMVVTRQHTDKSLIELFHPCQLEKRFGGAMDSPVDYWPPYVGQDFIPEAELAERQAQIISDDEYLKRLESNPLLPVHPEFLRPEQFSRDFLIDSPRTVIIEPLEPMEVADTPLLELNVKKRGVLQHGPNFQSIQLPTSINKDEESLCSMGIFEQFDPKQETRSGNASYAASQKF